MKYNETLLDIQDRIQATCNLGEDDSCLVVTMNLDSKTNRLKIEPNNRNELMSSFMTLFAKVVEVQTHKMNGNNKEFLPFSFAIIEGGLPTYQFNSEDVIWKGE